ncbi:MAG: hypothetical protein FJW31_11205 [Acidobacteria bacterium]|nr:hypothetical protein [Acidobacteriota bacterium]
MKAATIFALMFGSLALAQAVPQETAVERIRQNERAKGAASVWLSPRMLNIGPVQRWLPAGHDGPCYVRMPGMDAMKNWQGDPRMATSPAVPQTMPQASVPAPPCPAK